MFDLFEEEEEKINSFLSTANNSFCIKRDGDESSGRITFGQKTFGRKAFGSQTLGQHIFGRQTLGHHIFGRQTFG